MNTQASIRPLSAMWWASIPNHVWEAASGVALSASFFMVGFGDWAMVATVAGVVWGLAFLGPAKMPGWAVLSIAIIMGSTAGAMYFADAKVAATAMTIWVALMGAVFIMRHTMHTVWWTMPAAGVQAGALWYDRIMLPDVARVSGLMTNSNPAAGLMVLASVLLLTHKRTQWLAIPFLAAIPMTGSRAAVGAMAVMLMVLAMKRAIGGQKVLAITVVVVLATMPFWGTMTHGLRLNGDAATIVQTTIENVRLRVAPEEIKEAETILPAGPGTDISNQHIQVMRISQEVGILAGLAWVTILFGAMWQRQAHPAWFMLFAAALLTIFDMYFWIPAGLTVMWWMLANIQLQEKAET
jgi:hypothetical protein